MPPPRDPYSAGLPDFKYINGIPILDAVEKIGLEVRDDKRIVCPRTDRHKNGSTAFLKLLPRNKVKCDACDTGPLSVVDLLMHVGEFDSPRDAALCFAPNLDVPAIAKGSHLNNPDCQVVPPTCEDPIGLLILSGLWRELSVTSQRLAPVLLVLSKWRPENPEPTFRLSYLAMTRFSKVTSPNQIKAAIDELVGIGWMERLGSPTRGDSPVRDTAQYRLTPLSDSFRKFADATATPFGDDIKAEKAIQMQRRHERIRRFQAR